MRSELRTLTLLLGLVTIGRDVLASEPSSVPAQSRKDAASETGKASTKPAPPAAPATASTAPPPPARQETLDEIVARVRRRLATEVPRQGPRPVAPRPPVVERVKLVWRPAVVWPSELVGSEPAVSAPVADPNRPTPTRDSR